MWEQLSADLSDVRDCTTPDCGGVPVVRFNGTSDYCADCARRIERMRQSSAESNEEIDGIVAMLNRPETKPPRWLIVSKFGASEIHNSVEAWTEDQARSYFEFHNPHCRIVTCTLQKEASP